MVLVSPNHCPCPSSDHFQLHVPGKEISHAIPGGTLSLLGMVGTEKGMRRERLFIEQVPTSHGISPENQKVSIISPHSIGRWCRNPPAAVRRTALRSGFANALEVKHLQILQTENDDSGPGGPALLS